MIYETQFDLEIERKVANTLATIWNCEVQKMPLDYRLDWIFLKNKKPVAVAELKNRNCNKDHFPTLMLTVKKWMAGKALAVEMGIPFLVIINWQDGLFWCKAGVEKLEYAFNGRKDRGDPNDLSPMVFLPISKFKKIGECVK